jgi:HK97 family phage portal protein
MAFPNAATRDLGPAWYAVMGIDRDAPPEYRTPSAFARAPADEAWVYSCVRRIYQAGAGVPLRVYVKHGRDLIPAADEPSPEGDDLQALLDYVNPVDMTGNDLKSYTLASMAVWGECFWHKLRGRLGGPPQELYWLRSPDMEPYAPDGRRVITWSHRPNQGAAETFAARDVVAFKRPNLVNPLRGLSPLSSVGNEIATGVLWAQRLAATVANDSIPPGFWQVPKDAEFTKTDESLVRRTLRGLRERRNKGRVPIMPTGIDWKAISLTPRDAEAIASQKISRMAVCAAIGVPLVLAGDDEKTSVYANLRDAERVFWRGTMVGDLDAYADVAEQLARPRLRSDPEAARGRLRLQRRRGPEADARRRVEHVAGRHLQPGRRPQRVPAALQDRARRAVGRRPVPRTAVAIRPDPRRRSTPAPCRRSTRRTRQTSRIRRRRPIPAPPAGPARLRARPLQAPRGPRLGGQRRMSPSRRRRCSPAGPCPPKPASPSKPAFAGVTAPPRSPPRSRRSMHEASTSPRSGPDRVETDDVRIIEGLGYPFRGRDTYGTFFSVRSTSTGTSSPTSTRPGDARDQAPLFIRPSPSTTASSETSASPPRRLEPRPHGRRRRLGSGADRQAPAYYERLAPLLDANALGLSGGSAEHSVRIDQSSGEILAWPAYELA